MNFDVRNAMKSTGVHQWQVADVLGVSEFTLCRWMRKELSHDKRTRILNAIGGLSRKRSVNHLGS